MERYLLKAKELHEKNPVADAHLDLAGEILLRYKMGEEAVIRNRYLEQFRKANINLLLCSVYVDSDMLPEMGLRNTLDQISALYKDLESVKGEVFLVRSRQDVEKAVNGNKTGIILYMEGLDGIGKDLSLLKILYELGVRGASLTWSRRNDLATGCSSAGKNTQIKGGLSDLGISAIKEMERLGMFLDVSHLNDDGYEEVLKVAGRPFIATHTNARAVWDNYRNMTDEQMKKLADQGGIMGLNACSLITGSREKGNHIEMLCYHAEYECQIAGEDHVGYGFDLCDSYDEAKQKGAPLSERLDCLQNHGQMLILTAALLERGMKEKTVKKVIGGNFYRYFMNVMPE